VQDKPKRWTWDEWYDSPKAQDYCFRNCNRATRDEQIGEFCFHANEPHIEWLEAENKKKSLRPLVKFQQNKIEKLEARIKNAEEIMIHADNHMLERQSQLKELGIQHKYQDIIKIRKKASEWLRGAGGEQ